MARTLLVLLVALAASPPVGGAQRADLEREAVEIEAMLIAPCCYAQQVSVHQSAAADEIKADVRLRLAAGQTRQQILDAYVTRYGKRILAQPPAEGFDITLYALPLVLFFGSLGLIVVFTRRFARRAPAVPAAEPPVTAGVSERLDDELRDLD